MPSFSTITASLANNCSKNLPINPALRELTIMCRMMCTKVAATEPAACLIHPNCHEHCNCFSVCFLFNFGNTVLNLINEHTCVCTKDMYILLSILSEECGYGMH